MYNTPRYKEKLSLCSNVALVFRAATIIATTDGVLWGLVRQCIFTHGHNS